MQEMYHRLVKGERDKDIMRALLLSERNYYKFKKKERVENKDITAGTLKNFVKSLKVFCEMAHIPNHIIEEK